MGTSNNANEPTKYYSVVDRVIVAPDMTSHFSEKLLFMPHSYQVTVARLSPLLGGELARWPWP